jgi:hypothetical protein
LLFTLRPQTHDFIIERRLDTIFAGRRHDRVKKLLLPALGALLAGCTTPSGAPTLPIKTAPAAARYDNDRPDDLDHDLSRSDPATSSTATT